MADRTFPKPKALIISERDPKTGKTAELTFAFEDYLGQIAWSWPKWSELAYAEAQIRIGEAVEAAAEEGPVGLSLEDWEKFRECVIAVPIQGKHAHKIRKFPVAVLRAIGPDGFTSEPKRLPRRA